MILALDHIQLTVPAEREAAALAFYRDLLGLEEIEKPPALKKNGGAWFRIGAVEVHLSKDTTPESQQAQSKRHICLLVDDLARFRQRLVESGAAIIEDQQPLSGFARFYLRDPGGNRIEIAQRLEEK